MRFISLVRFPEAAHQPPVAEQKGQLGRSPEGTRTPPLQLIKDVIQNEDGKVDFVSGWTGRFDAIVRYDCTDAVQAARSMLVLNQLGFKTETGTAIDSIELDKAWTRATESAAVV